MEQLIVKNIALSFNRKRGKFILSVGSDVIEQNVCEFLQTMSFLVGKDIEEYLLNTDSRYDTVKIPLKGCGKAVTLDLADFIDFREAYNRQMFLLKLEDALIHSGIRLP